MTNMSMSIVGCLSAILFVTFNKMYNLSYTVLGFLVLINFLTQMIVDLILTFGSKYLNIYKLVKITPLLTVVGFIIYALIPFLFEKYALYGLVIGTIVFSSSSGLNEVLISPVIANLPSVNKERDMSLLHSTYAWGVVGFVLIGASYIHFIGGENWFYLPIICSIVPLIAFILFFSSKLPKLNTDFNNEKKENGFKKISFTVFCSLLIFFGGATECIMTQWCSSYVESALGIPKLVGDIFGLALFALMLAFGRTLYAKRGKNILKVLTICLIASIICYLVSSLFLNNIIALVFCILTGLSVSMLWPGSIILVCDKNPNASVGLFALMAVCGDLGGAIGPQLTGIIIDKASLYNIYDLPLTNEQFGLRVGILSSIVYPILALIILLIIKVRFYKNKKMNS